ncbi:membrane-associated tyrosine- and threonine-specific cdc2-inhibitory kinase-like [Amphiura filiformis]|uniref:membrane-associated tyrosine- and threonine-specific cdc2-inhibitory kinase-like n=1 Tax=Amphiura filiformis TaxID=82378 RepID=UPI003B21306E
MLHSKATPAVVQHNFVQANGFKSPRPTPKFFPEENKFSQKKYRSADYTTIRRESLVPRPPIKSAPPISRLFPNKGREDELRPREVSFRKSSGIFSADTSSLLQSPAYDMKRRDLYFDQCFQILQKLGEGAFGEVFKVRSKEDGHLYAIKRSRDRFKGEADKRRRLEEVNKHESLSKHPNCVEFHKAWAERGHLYIQTELCKISLLEFAEENHDIPESIVWDYLVDLLQGLKHLHDQNFLHLDLKPENIFFSFYGVCKVGDFGLTIELNKRDLGEAQEGDPQYLAPELLQGKFGKHADVFSLGITMLELACDLELPRNGALWHQLRKGEIPWDICKKNISESLKETISLMMHPDYQKRPTVDQLLSMPSLKRAIRVRRCKVAVKKVWTSVTYVFSFIITLLLRLWFLIIPSQPSDIMKSPELPKDHAVRRPSHWDLSFSDDDCFDSDISYDSFDSDISYDIFDSDISRSDISHGSLGCPLANSTFSSEDEGLNLNHSGMKQNHSRSKSPRKTPKPKTLFPPNSAMRLCNPRSSSPITKEKAKLKPGGSPNTSGLSDFCHTPTKSRLDFSSSFEEDDDVEANNSNLQPKNLMQMFHDFDSAGL